MKTTSNSPMSILGGLAIVVALFMLLKLFTTNLGRDGQVAVAGILLVGGALMRIEAAIRKNKPE
ncbi:hypothetical protein [Catellatospora paridis]|uniref:hypothetical protein n=1 Tax=Catellatospora paridis TaxID=1617086 RepID=UPI0012D4BB92|nr:hypothetical protein [Catellatospora paridis]